MIWTSKKEDTSESSSVDEKENSNDDAKNRVETLNNRIYFYSEVTRSKVLTLNKKLTSLNTSILNQVNTLELDGPQAQIRLHINSFGGSVFSGLSACDSIKKSKVPLISIIDGCAASAATLMSVVASERYMQEHAFMLIHQLSSVSWGKYEELKDSMKSNDLLMKTIKDIYIEHTKIPKKKLTAILKHDLWWNARTCLKYGLIDEIVV